VFQDESRPSGSLAQAEADQHEDHDLSDLLQELRILLQGVQVLTAFLVILPFSEGFGRLDQFEKWVYLATFVSSLGGLVFISAPAAQHRLQRPLRSENRVRFKHFATQMIVVGLAMFSVALVMASQLVSNEVVGFWPSVVIAAIMAGLIGVVWWLIPMTAKVRRITPTEDDSQSGYQAPATVR
jgi:4-hydroxybenzoate polyprenyltransferase